MPSNKALQTLPLSLVVSHHLEVVMSFRGALIRTITLVALLVAAHVAQADPDEVADRYFDSLAAASYVDAAAMFDPQELQEIRDLLRFVYESEGSGDQLLAAFFGSSASADAVADLSDAEFFAAILEFTMEQAKKAVPINFGNIRTLGYVAEPPDKAHVVTRFDLELGTEPISMIEVVSMRQVGDEWKLLMQADVKALARQLKASYGSSE